MRDSSWRAPQSRSIDSARSGADAGAASFPHLLFLLVAACVVATYFWKCSTARSELGNTTARDAYYNRLVDGLASGRLDLALTVPEGLKNLPNPYDPEANSAFRGLAYETERLHDLSYFRGKLYLYFGLTPALLLFWPYHAVTGAYVSHQVAVAFFSAVGFLLSVGLLRAIWRRSFPEVSAWWLTSAALLLGFGTSVPAMLSRPDVWEVPVSAGYALIAAALALGWRALHDPRSRWLWGASLCWALAVGARPSLLLGSPVLVAIAVARWRATERAARHGTLRADALAVFVPMLAIGGALAAYNHARFGSILEFGQHYQLAGDRQDTGGKFSVRYAPYNAQLYFLSRVPAQPEFPFWGDVVPDPKPDGHGDVERPFGILTNTPATLLALVCALPLAVFCAHPRLRFFCGTLAALFAINAGLLCCFYGACTRYQVDFHPWLGLVAAVGLLAATGLSDGRGWRWAAGTALLALVGYSAIFGYLRLFQFEATSWFTQGRHYARHKQWPEALQAFDRATAYGRRRIEPRFQAAIACEALGRHDESFERYKELLELDPKDATFWNNAGRQLQAMGRTREALEYYHRAVELQPKFALAHINVGAALLKLIRPEEAAEAFREAIRLDPNNDASYYGLGIALVLLGKAEEGQRYKAKALELRSGTAPAR